jgi:hypothetical protein
MLALLENPKLYGQIASLSAGRGKAGFDGAGQG